MRATNHGPARRITNFGGNVTFRPGRYYQPETEEDVLQILNAHARGTVRAIGSLHSWSDVITSGDAVVDLGAFDKIELEEDDAGAVWATVGAGVTIEKLLATLDKWASLTLPTTPESTMQTLVGAISTATHGAGMPSLSHFVGQVRAAAYDPRTGRARIYEWSGGPELRAASCALGCMGIILSVRIRTVPQYSVFQVVQRYNTLDEVLEAGRSYPLQEFILVPYSWAFYAFNRRPLRRRAEDEGSARARLHRAYKWGIQDALDHAALMFLLRTARKPGLVRWFLENLFPLTMQTNSETIDRSDLALVREHEMFRHVEMEVFVPGQYLPGALDFVREVVMVFAGIEEMVSAGTAQALASIGLLEYLLEHRATYQHHYPISVRKVTADDAMIATTAGVEEPHYAISLFSYTPEREEFYVMAAFLAHSMNRLFVGRLHWGKYFPLANADIEPMYPEMAAFRRICREVDPNGVFLNTYARQVLGFPLRAEPDAEEIDI